MVGKLFFRSTLIIVISIFLLGSMGCSNRATSYVESGGVDNTRSLLTNLNDYGTVPDFSLITQSGKPITSAKLKGDVWIADFFFTRCQSICPLLTSQMVKFNKKLAPQGLKLLSISFDAEYDKPEVLQAYAKEVNAKEEEWLFLTGDKKKIIDLSVNGFKLGGNEDPMSHSSRFILIDRAGHIRGYYRSEEEEDLKKLMDNAEILLKEK